MDGRETAGGLLADSKTRMIAEFHFDVAYEFNELNVDLIGLCSSDCA